MTQFRIKHAPPFNETGRGTPANDRYFTVDTAERQTINGWKQKNPHYLTYIFDGDEFAGFLGILPVTMECGEMLERQEILEEEINPDLVLGPEAMQYAQYLYIAAIAIEDVKSYKNKQAAAALVSFAAGMMKNLYGHGHLKKVFANPTTYWGNRIVGRFGLKPVVNKKRSLKAGNDIYAVEADEKFWTQMDYLEQRYQRFILNYPWQITHV